MDISYIPTKSCFVVAGSDVVSIIYNSNHITLPNEWVVDGIDNIAVNKVTSKLAFASKRKISIVEVPDISKINENLSLAETNLERNCSTLSWSEDGDELIAGDKSGGVWLVYKEGKIFDIPAPLASRVAMTLSVHLIGDSSKKFLAVGDRDARLSVFHYPACHNLHSVCLGHSQYISDMATISRGSFKQVITLGGDGKVCLWDILSGKLLAHLNLFTEGENISCRNRPKKLYLLTTTLGKCGCQSNEYLVSCENSGDLYSFTLTLHDNCEDKTKELMMNSDRHNLLNPILKSDTNKVICGCEVIRSDPSPILAVAVFDGSDVSWALTTDNTDKSNLEEYSTQLKLVQNVKFSPRSARLWLEKNPRPNVAEYIAKRKKTALMSLNEGNSSDESDN